MTGLEYGHLLEEVRKSVVSGHPIVGPVSRAPVESCPTSKFNAEHGPWDSDPLIRNSYQVGWELVAAEIRTA